MAIPVLTGVAFGFFIGCSTFNKSQSPTGATRSTKELERHLDRVERRISQHPQDAEAYYQKGDLLNSLAHRTTDPSERVPYYSEMTDALSEAATLYGTASNPPGAGKVDELLKVSWSFEHNQGVEIMQSDSTLKSDDFKRAADHFSNAISIIPDSVVSYRMKASAHYRNHEVDQAVATLETARRRIDKRLPSTVLEQLAYLYLEQERPDRAVALYEQAESFSDDNLNLIHGLANAYITAGSHEEAVDLLNALVENEPENIIYLQSYGNELYNLGIEKFRSMHDPDSGNTVALSAETAEADSLMELAESQYRKALELNPENTELKKQLATFYQNYAIQLTQVKPLFPTGDRDTIEQRVKQNLSRAVSLFEELVNDNPELAQYWKNLYQAYSYLGMQQKANEAKAKANL